MKRTYTLLITILIATHSFGQMPTLLKDIGNYATLNSIGEDVSYCTIGNITYFTANDGIRGVEIWKTDGTEAGTVMLKDIFPGSQSSSPKYLVNVNGTLFFTAIDSNFSNYRLWKSDGTETGTVKVKNVLSALLTEVNGILFFQGSLSATGKELWRSDGTEAGTVMIKDIVPGSDGSEANNLININGTVFFTAYDRWHDNELWKSDGTESGTVLVKKINPAGVSSSPPEKLVDLNGTLFFAADDGTHGKELWKSDGTEAGTVMVKDINPSSAISLPSQLTVVDTLLYFTAIDGTEGIDSRLWKTNGTTEGTVAVTDAAANTISADYLTNSNNMLFFAGSSTGLPTTELWKSNGTATGTIIVKNLITVSTDARPVQLTNVNGTLYFTVSQGLNGLWKSDGTEGGTVQVYNNSVAGYGAIYNTYSDGSRLFFCYTTDTTGTETWISDGTEEGTTILKDINTTTAGSAVNSFIQIGNFVFFAANDGLHGMELWKTDGTSAGTQMVKDLFPSGSAEPFYFKEINGTLFFLAQTALNNWALCKSDGTSDGTQAVTTTVLSNIGNFANLNGTLFFTARDNTHGSELWKSDGTDTGTVLVKDITPGIVGSSINNLINVDGTLFFSMVDYLYKSDGTAAGTVPVKNIRPATENKFISFNGRLFFTASDSINGTELWVSDGTEAGTTIFKEFVPGPTGSFPRNIRVIENSLYFAADNNGNNRSTGLYKSDGTPEGTVVVTMNPDGSNFCTDPDEFTAVGNTVFFTAVTATGRELWKTDGTGAGTMQVKDIYPGNSTDNPKPQYLTAVNDTLYFGAGDNTYGNELWKSDGTTGGTVPIDIVPGTGSSFSRYLTRFNNNLLFSATDPEHGAELWILKATPAVWKGDVSTAWEIASNWSDNKVPTDSSNVIIPPGRPRYPVVNASTTVKSIRCAEGSAVVVAAGVVLNVLK